MGLDELLSLLFLLYKSSSLMSTWILAKPSSCFPSQLPLPSNCRRHFPNPNTIRRMSGFGSATARPVAAAGIQSGLAINA
ncbi:hypothetical protein V6N13_002542 [Hibiscus sabdariffa]|uniref:Uncharacterized protein n=1 Tax=Hibiscus sabdariffa TaxID=183260 RepID=A0ABR2C353_9ROSI